MSGRAIPAGTGEIRFTQYDESRGVSTGTGIMSRRRPRRRAYVRIMSPYERMSGPPISTTPGHLRVVERADEVVEHVGDPDRLATGPHPAGRDHDRQALGQVAQDLERRAAGSDDHRRPELGDRHAMRGELGAGLVAAGQVVGEVGGIVAQAAEVDDPRHAGTPRRLGEVAGCLPVALGESPFTRPHRVRQVVGDVDPLERHRQRRWVEEVGDDDRRLREPGGEGPRVAAHQDELVSRAASSGTSRPPM